MTADEFNARFPVGAPVRYYPIMGHAECRETRTRSEAWELGSGHVVVKIEGLPGGVAIRNLECAKPVKLSKLLQAAVSQKHPLWVAVERGELVVRARTAFHENGNITSRVCHKSRDIGRLIGVLEAVVKAGGGVGVEALWETDFNRWDFGWKPEYHERLKALR
jgi:hypothetical protein